MNVITATLVSLSIGCAASAPPAGGSPGPATAEATAAPKAAATAAPTETPEPVASPPAGPTAELSGATITFSYQGKSYTLSHSAVVPVGNSWELHFEQPWDVGYNQIWLMPRDVKKGEPARVEGTGMTALFLQLADGMDNVRNVSNDCSASGSVAYDEIPQVGGTASGSVDVTITCDGVAAITGPIVIKGTFAGVPVKN